MAISYVDSNSNVTTFASVTVPVDVSGLGLTAGDLVFFYVDFNNDNRTITAGQTGGTTITWTPVWTTNVIQNGHTYNWWWGIVGASAPTSIDATASGTSGYAVRCLVSVLRGVDQANPIDQYTYHQNNDNQYSHSTGTTATLAYSDDYAIATFGGGGNTITGTASGFSHLINLTHICVSGKQLSATTGVELTFASSTGCQDTCLIAAFQADHTQPPLTASVYELNQYTTF